MYVIHNSQVIDFVWRIGSFFEPPVRLPNIAMRDLIFTLRCAQRTLINDSESKGVGGGLQENNLNVQKQNFRKQSISALPYPLAHCWHSGKQITIECVY